MDKILIDTDVILDFFFDRKPFSDDAAMILSWCEMKKIQGFVTPVIISNSYYLLKKNATHAKVIEKLKKLISIVDILLMDKEVVINALNSGFPDFEDALQNFSAIRSKKIDLIITRNLKDYNKSDLVVFTPEAYLKNIIPIN
ncbi:MAG TPA: PIN domain-containing protein [Hanamia sp.]